MKKIWILGLIFCFILVSHAEGWIFLTESENISRNQYPLWMKFSDNTIFIGNRDLPQKLNRNMEGKPYNGDLYLAMSREHDRFERIGSDATILYVYGGFILFSASDNSINRILEKQDETFVVTQAEFPSVVTDSIKFRSTERNQKNPDIQKYVDMVSRERLINQVNHLVDYGTRYTFTNQFKKVSEDYAEIFRSLNLETRIEEFSNWSGKGYNIIGVKPGRIDEQIIVIGHIDSTSQRPKEVAPGADDNGSGAAGVVEMARVLKDYDSEYTLIYILAGGEENCLLGSTDYVKRYAGKHPIKYVINMDMIGFTKDLPNVIYLETHDFAEDFVRLIAEAGQIYSDFENEISFYAFGSDHIPFLRRNIPAVLTIEKEWDKNPNYHKTSDLPEDMNFEYMTRVVRMNVGTLLMLDFEK